MTRLKVHLLAEAGVPHTQIAEKLDIGLRSVERIVKEAAPTAEEISADERLVGPRRGRPSKVAKYEESVRALLAEEPELPGTEVLRRSRVWGYRGSRSPMLDLVKRIRPPAPAEPVVRFEGLPGEFAQFDFGHAKVKFAGGKRRIIHFFAARLKYSRFMHVVIVPNEQAETVIRAILARVPDGWARAPRGSRPRPHAPAQSGRRSRVPTPAGEVRRAERPREPASEAPSSAPASRLRPPPAPDSSGRIGASGS